MATYTHVFKNYIDQINTLDQYGIKYQSKAYATHILKVYSLENLTDNYKKTDLFDTTLGKFNSEMTLDTLVNLYLFECSLKTILLKYIRIIEDELKENISYQVAEKYGVWTSPSSIDINTANDYLNKANYSDSSGFRDNTLIDLKKLVVSPLDYQKNIIQYKNSSNIPPRVLAKDLYFSLIIKWFKILNKVEKDEIINTFIPHPNILRGTKADFVVTALKALSDLRNNCAHSESLCGFKASSSVDTNIFSSVDGIMPDLIARENFKKQYKRDELYVVVIAMYILLDDTIKRYFLVDLSIIFGEIKELDYIKPIMLSIFNFPDDMFEKFMNVAMNTNVDTKKVDLRYY